MAVTNGWGKGTQNNSNGWGKFQNTIGAASIYEDSYSGETVLIGTSAAFSYSKSSFNQGEADPTPTITGTTGGTFSATPSGLSINTSTGTIDLDNSTIQSYTITYTVSGVSANQTLAVTASPFIANNFSMNFNGVDNYINLNTVNLGTTQTVSYWIKRQNNPTFSQVCPLGDATSGLAGMLIYMNVFAFYYRVGATNVAFTNSLNGTIGSWTHCLVVRNGASVTLYVNGNLISTNTLTGGDVTASVQVDTIGASAASTPAFFLKGDMDEVALWNVALSSDAVTEIYNATANNTGKVLDLSTDYNNYTSSSNLQYWNRLGD